jgi:excinuclease ABC subunit C
MDDYSEKQEYEKAAESRDAIKAVEAIMSEQKVVGAEDKNIDVIDYLYRDNVYYFCVLSIRSGRLIGKKIDVFSETAGQEGAFELYLYQYYNRRISYPEEVILAGGSVKTEIAAEIFKNKGIKPVFKKRDSLLKMARENIEERKKQHEKITEQKEKSKEKTAEAIKELGENLYMKKPPLTIEGIDVSHLQGENLVASCVVFKNGVPDKNSYRRYKVKTVTGVDDYKSISEVVMRRYSRMLKEDAKFPDLILIDGGIGQVNAAKEALSLTGIEDVEIIGLAKKEELVFKPGENKSVPITEKARFLLQRVRDEAHRFALSYQTLLANKKLKKSIFDDIPYIGEKIKYRLYNEFRDKDDLIKAIDEGDKRASFLNKRQKEEILKRFRGV